MKPKNSIKGRFEFYTLPAFVFALFLSPAHAIDVIPGYAVAPPPDMNSFMASLVNIETGDRYIQGRKQGLDTKLNISNLLLRYTRSFSINGKPAGFYIQPSLGTVEPGGSLSGNDNSTGIGDTGFAFAYWPYANRETGDYFSLTGYLIAPTGKYDSNKLVNLGQNRYGAAFKITYHTKLTDSVEGMLSTDVQWFGDNDDYRLTHQHLEQKPLYSTQATLMYIINKQFMLAGSYFIHTGGETQLDGVDQDDRIKRDRYQLAVMGKFSFGKLILQFGSDLDTENGFIESQHAILRYQRLWK
ncbi:MAG: transporter [Candidatus Thiodiazotropha sp. LLP2]